MTPILAILLLAIAQPSPTQTVTINGQTVTAPAGARVRVIDDGEAMGIGAGMRTTNADATGTFNPEAPAVTLNGATGTGGGLVSDFAIKGIRDAAGSPLVWVGILCFLGAGACFLPKPPLVRGAMICAGMGAILIAAAFYPWAFALAGLGLVAYLVAEYGGVRFKEALRATVGGIAAADDDAKAKVKAEVAKQADAADSKVIAKIKAADGL